LVDVSVFYGRHTTGINISFVAHIKMNPRY